LGDKYNIINARITFRNVPIHKIERYSFKDIPKAYKTFMEIPGVSECVIIQTASRVELFTVNNLQEGGETPDGRRVEGRNLDITLIRETWASLTNLDQFDLEHFDQTLEMFKNADVCTHLLELATGLDSLVIGKEEIFDEIRNSISTAKESNVAGKILNKLFDNTIMISTRIRNSSGISENVQSIGDIAVKMAEDNAGIDSKKKILLIGTGETAATVAKSLNKKEYAFEVTSMSIQRATGFSKLLGGTPIEYEQVLKEFDKFHIIFVATTADYILISHNRIRKAMEKNKGGTMILDISNPRAVDDSVTSFPGVKLMLRDQISELYEENAQARDVIVPEVQKMITKETPILEATIKI